MSSIFTENKKKLRPLLEDPSFKEMVDEIQPGLHDKLVKILLMPILNKKDMRRALQSKIWRLNYCYKIVDKNTQTVPFVMTRAQFKVYLTLIRHRRIINLKSRQQGISTLFVISFMDDCIVYDDTKSGLLSLGKDQAKELLRRCRLTWEYMEPWAKKELRTKLTSNNKQSHIEFNNNSQVLMTVKFRSHTMRNLHISELGMIAEENPAKAAEIFTGSIQTVNPNGCVAIESTAMGENKFAKLWRDAEKNYGKEVLPIDTLYPVFLSWLDDPDCNEDIAMDDTDEFKAYEKELKKQGLSVTKTQKNFWIAKYESGLYEKTFQEYPATPADAFKATTKGVILATRYLKKAHKDVFLGGDHDREHNNWVKSAPVYATFDLGIKDPTSIIWFQLIEGKFIILREYNNTRGDMAHYSRVLRQYCSENRDRPKGNPAYIYEQIIMPHDARNPSYDEGNPTPEQLMLERGWSVVISKSKAKSVQDVMAINEIMERIYINTELCPILHKAFLNYRFEEKPDGTFGNRPLHDEHSHPIDSLRYGVIEKYRELIDNAIPGALESDEGFSGNVGDGDEPQWDLTHRRRHKDNIGKHPENKQLLIYSRYSCLLYNGKWRC